SQEIINLPAEAPGGTDRPIVVDSLAALNAQLSDAIADRIEAEPRYRQAGPAGATSEALINPAINRLRERRAELAAEYERMMVRFEPAYPGAISLQSQIEELDRAIARED